MEGLVAVIRELALARSLEAVDAIVRKAEPDLQTDDERRILHALSQSASVAIESANLHRDLEDRLRKRTAELEATNQELEAFSYAVSHDLRAPLRAIQGFSQAVLEDASEHLDVRARKHLDRVIAGTTRMNELIDALLGLSRVGRGTLVRSRVDITMLANEIATELRGAAPTREVTFTIAPGLVATADPQLVRALLSNLLSNAWKFTSKKPRPTIDVGESEGAFFVKDTGAGFDETYASKLFTPFQRLHSAEEYSGTGIGLATAQRIVRRHGGEIHASGAKDVGATFRFTLG